MLKDHQRVKFFIYAALLSTLGLFASDMYLPALENIQHHFSANAGTIALSMSVYMVGFAIAQLIYGPISDQVGRKLPLLTGLLIFLTGTLGCIFTTSVGGFLAFRLVQAIGVGAAYVLWQPMVVDIFPSDEVHKQFSRLMAFGSVSPAVAPLLGGIMAEALGWQSVFWLLCAITALLVGWTQFAYRERGSFSGDARGLLSGAFRNYSFLLGDKTFLFFSFAMACGISMYLVFLTTLPLALSNLGYASDTIGLMYLPLVGAFVLGSEVSKRQYHKFGDFGNARIGVFLGILGAVVLFSVSMLVNIQSSWQLVLPFSLVTFGNGFLIPTGMAFLIRSNSDRAGSCASMAGFMLAFFGGLATFLASAMWNEWKVIAMAATILLFALGMLVFFFSIPRDRQCDDQSLLVERNPP